MLGHYGDLACAGCGEEQLHHTQVQCFERQGGEDGPVYAVIHNAGKIYPLFPQKTKEEINPSDRRNGVRIVFYCEVCPAITALEIAQHKGSTKMETKLIGAVEWPETDLPAGHPFKL